MPVHSQSELPSVPKWIMLRRRFARPIRAREPQSVVSRHAPLRFRNRGKSTTQMKKARGLCPRAGGVLAVWLELQPDGELHDAIVIARRGDLTQRSRGLIDVIRARVAEVRVVQHIERLSAEHAVQTFANFEALRKASVNVKETRTIN